MRRESIRYAALVLIIIGLMGVISEAGPRLGLAFDLRRCCHPGYIFQKLKIINSIWGFAEVIHLSCLIPFRPALATNHCRTDREYHRYSHRVVASELVTK